MNTTTRHLSKNAAVLALAVLSTATAGWAADAVAPGTDPWTGFYLGAQAGYMQDSGDPDICVSVRNASISANSDAVLVSMPVSISALEDMSTAAIEDVRKYPLCRIRVA